MAFATAQSMGLSSLQNRTIMLNANTSSRRMQSRSTSGFVVRAAKNIRDEVPGAPGISVPDKGQKDSYERIEEPVRGDSVKLYGGPPVGQRREARDDLYIQTDGSAEKEALGTEVAFPDAMRFNGAAPEVINSRLAMLGCVAALAAELTTQTTVFEQFSKTPGPIIGTFVLFSVASLIPILKGVPRRGGKYWGGLPQFTPDAEITVGRVAMLGFLGIVVNELITKTPAI